MTRNFYLAGRGWTERRVFTTALGVLLVIDAFFFGAHILRAALNETAYHGFLLDRGWSLELDRSYPEFFQYLLAASTSLTLFVLYTQRKSLTYLGWALAFLFILADDSLSLHEWFTRVFAEYTSSAPLFGLETSVYAASLLWGAVGLALLAFLALGYRRNPDTRRFSRRLVYILAALFFFGGFVDALHLLVHESHASRMMTFFFGTLEDGGELIVMSVALALTLSYAYGLSAQTKGRA